MYSNLYYRTSRSHSPNPSNSLSTKPYGQLSNKVKLHNQKHDNSNSNHLNIQIPAQPQYSQYPQHQMSNNQNMDNMQSPYSREHNMRHQQSFNSYHNSPISATATSHHSPYSLSSPYTNTPNNTNNMNTSVF